MQGQGPCTVYMASGIAPWMRGQGPCRVGSEQGPIAWAGYGVAAAQCAVALECIESVALVTLEASPEVRPWWRYLVVWRSPKAG